MRGAFSFSGSTVQTSLTPRYLLFDDWWRGRHPREHFERWVPPPPNPPPMTAKEKHLAAVRRFEEPPLCHCGDRAMINPDNTLEFVCPNKHEVSAKCICSKVELYVSCTNVTLFRCIQWRSVVSRSGCMVLRTNGPKNLQKQNKRRKNG